MEDARSINEYYTNLEYGINDKKEALKRISNLCLGLKFEDVNNFAVRLSETALIMQDNFLLFASVCEHIDVVNSIIDYLKYFSAQLMHDTKGEFRDNSGLIASLMATIFNISLESEVQLFLENAIIKNTRIQNTLHKDTKTLISQQKIDIILLEESDMYAFISYLKIKNVMSCLNKIWVQISIKKAFQWYIKKYFGHLSVPIDIFQSKQELFSLEIFCMEFRIFSIWSEDIVGARNLAMSMKGHVVFINTHMNFCASILLPYTKILDLIFRYEDKSDSKLINSETDTNYNLFSNKHNLFYNGMWQKPVTNTYWKYNDTLLANATSEDMQRCIDSAIQGFKIWSAESINSRMHILSQLALILEYKNESLLADIVSKWLKLQYFSNNQLTHHETEFKQQKFEITKIRIPRGIILLEEKDKVTMFRELTQSLITGNSVIVVCNPDLCTLPLYCDIFSTAKIPPGVINFLSSKFIKSCSYDELAALNPEEVYSYLTMNKHIVVCLK